MKNKKKILAILTSFIACMVFMVAAKTAPVYAFGGDHTFTDPNNGKNYSKESCTQLSTSFDSSGNLVVTGYSFFTYTQQYLTKGTTHSYRLKIDGTNLVYTDVLVGGANYTSIADDSGITWNLGTGEIYVCDGTQAGDTQLQQVSFKFIIPAADLKKLTPDVEYRLTLECTLKNVRYAANKNTKHTVVKNITKLIDANLMNNKTVSKSYDTSYGKSTVSVSAMKDFTSLRVNAEAVLARNSSLNKFSDYNDGYFVKRGASYAAQRDILYSPANASYITSDYLGETYIPLVCNYTKTSTSSSITSLTLDQLFAKNPSLKTEYNNNLTKISQMNSQISTIMTSSNARNCKTASHFATGIVGTGSAYDQGGPCATCLANKGYIEKINARDALISRNSEIESKCYTTTTTTSTSQKTANLYCKTFYLEAPKGKDYWTSIIVKQDTANIAINTQYQIENVNSTTLGAIQKGGTSTKPLNKINIDAGKAILDYYSSGSGPSCPTGYHIDTVKDSYTNMSFTPKEYHFYYNIKLNKGIPDGQSITVSLVFRNDAPKIQKK